MDFNGIGRFYKVAMAQEKFSPEFFIELREISSEGELEKFIEERVQPVAKNMGYNFSTEDLLSYESEIAQKLTEQQLKNISGGAGTKNWILGGLVSLMALGAGAIGATSSANAELTSKTVASSTTTLMSKIEKEISFPQNEDKTDNFEQKKENKTTKAENETGAKTISQSGKISEKSDLETAQNATQVDQTEIVESRNLTEDQKLYILKALNLQDAYALLQSGVIENLRLFGNISEIQVKNGVRQCTADHGDPYVEFYYPLFPSNAGTLSTSGGGHRFNFSKFGGISPELMAKFCAIANDYRNGKILNKEFNNIKNLLKNTQTTYVKTKGNSGLIVRNEATTLLKRYGIIPEVIGEHFVANENSPTNDKIRFYSSFLVAMKESIDLEDINKTLTTNINEINKEIDKIGVIDKDQLNAEKVVLKTQKSELETDINNKRNDFKKTEVNNEELKKELGKLSNELKKIGEQLKELAKKENLIERAANLEEQKKILEQDLEKNQKNPWSYPKYLVEHSLMAYMIKALSTEEDVEKLYQGFIKQLSKNETNKTVRTAEERENITEEIEKEKIRLSKLNKIINSVKFNELSPYEICTQQNGITCKIGKFDENEKVVVKSSTFADCADITVRHLVNLLIYSNDQNWDLLLNGANIDDLSSKLSETIKIINNKGQVQFYDLKTRLQMFFLYQRENGADDVTTIARTLWEYVICNMDIESLEKGPDKNKGFYKISYNQENMELNTGYINLLKLMWNIASAINLGFENIDGKTKLDLAKESIDNITNTEKQGEYEEGSFKLALNSVFSLFNVKDEIDIIVNDNITLKDGEFYNDNNNLVTIKINKEDKSLNFDIIQMPGHAYIYHIPYKFCFDEKFKENEYNFDTAKLLLRSFTNEYYPSIEGIYGAFSSLEVNDSDKVSHTDLYKRMKVLVVYALLRDEESNVERIMNEITPYIMKCAKKIRVNELKGTEKVSKNLSEVLYETYIKPNLEKFDANYVGNIWEFEKNIYGFVDKIYTSIHENFRQKITDFDVIKVSKNNEVRLIINNENLRKLTIPSNVYSENGTEFNVVCVDSYLKEERKSVQRGRLISCYTSITDNLVTLEFAGVFDNLIIMPHTFSRNYSLKHVNFACIIESLKIGKNAFFECINLYEFNIPKYRLNTLNIEDYAFSRCRNLRKFIIPLSVTNLTFGEYVLERFEVHVPNHLKKIIPRYVATENNIIFYST